MQRPALLKSRASTRASMQTRLAGELLRSSPGRAGASLARSLASSCRLEAPVVCECILGGLAVPAHRDCIDHVAAMLASTALRAPSLALSETLTFDRRRRNRKNKKREKEEGGEGGVCLNFHFVSAQPPSQYCSGTFPRQARVVAGARPPAWSQVHNGELIGGGASRE